MSDVIYQVSEYHALTPHVTQVFLDKHSGPALNYEAGQYIKIIHPDDSSSPFSIANAPNDLSRIELHLLALKDNRKAMDILQMVKDKKDFKLRGPFGTCTASALDKNRPIIFIARGTGFSPVKAVIEALIQKPDYPPIHFYWSVPGWRDLYQLDLINEWVAKVKHFHFTAVLTREQLISELGVQFGEVSEIVQRDHPNLSGYQVYASGPQTMIYSAVELFQKQGLPREYFYSDIFDYQP